MEYVGQRLVALFLLVLLIGDSRPAWARNNVWVGIGPDGGSINFLTADPKDFDTLYAGTSEGVFKSTDGGASWITSPLPVSVGSVVLAIDPKNSRTIYAGSAHGVFKSTDAGESWVGTAMPALTVSALAIDPQNPSILYAAIWALDGGPRVI